MIKLIYFVIILFFSQNLMSQSVVKKQRMVQQVIENMFDALSIADTGALKKYCTSEVRFYEYGEIWTLDTLFKKVMQSKSIPDFKRKNNFEFVNTNIHNKSAWVTYYLQSGFTRNGKEELVKWMETVVLIKNAKKWKINVLHSTRLK